MLIEHEYRGNLIGIVQMNGEKETYVLINKKHTSIPKLAEVLGIKTTEAEEFLRSVNKTKPLRFTDSLAAVQLRIICLMGYAGTKIKS